MRLFSLAGGNIFLGGTLLIGSFLTCIPSSALCWISKETLGRCLVFWLCVALSSSVVCPANSSYLAPWIQLHLFSGCPLDSWAWFPFPAWEPENSLKIESFCRVYYIGAIVCFPSLGNHCCWMYFLHYFGCSRKECKFGLYYSNFASCEVPLSLKYPPLHLTFCL